MDRIWRLTWLVWLAGSVAVLSGGTCVPPGIVPGQGGNRPGDPGGTGNDPALADQVIEQVNSVRASDGLGALVKNDLLTRAAEDYAARMATLGFFSHTDAETGSQPWDRAQAAGYSYVILTENLAAGPPTVDDVVNGWMSSPGHRENILLPGISDTGVGVYEGGPLGIYWVQMFGAPR